MKYKDISGVILSGGKNSRMGTDKAFLKVGGVLFIEKQIALVQQFFEDIIIVTNSPEKYEKYSAECDVISDRVKDCGPVSGIHAALVHTKKDAIMCIACDMPYLEASVIDELSAVYQNASHENDCIISKCNDFMQPLCSLYRKSFLPILEHALKGHEFKMRALIRSSQYHLLEFPITMKKAFDNVNTTADYEQM